MFFDNLDDFEEPTHKNRIGSGSYGTVYKLKEKKTDKIWAVKILDDRNPYLELKKSFLQETFAMSNLNYPTLVHLYGICKEPFSLITDYISNETIQDNRGRQMNTVFDYIIKASKGDAIDGWDLTVKMIIILGIGFGMKYLHENNIIHRNLKPNNILLDSNFYPRICDFGFAKNISHSLIITSTIGNLIFQAPEIKTNKYGREVDVYSFGMTMYSILYDKIPFMGEEDKTGQVGARPTLEEGIISKALENIITKCWEDDPIKRPNFEEICRNLLEEIKFMVNRKEIEEEGITKIKNFFEFCKFDFVLKLGNENIQQNNYNQQKSNQKQEEDPKLTNHQQIIPMISSNPSKSQKPRAELNEEQIEDIKDAFEIFDEDKNGVINRHELRIAIRALGFEVSKADIIQIMKEKDPKNTGKIDLYAFYEVVSEIMAQLGPIEETRKFSAPDDDDNTGIISIKVLRRVANELGENLTNEELQTMIEELNNSHNNMDIF